MADGDTTAGSPLGDLVAEGTVEDVAAAVRAFLASVGEQLEVELGKARREFLGRKLVPDDTGGTKEVPKEEAFFGLFEQDPSKLGKAGEQALSFSIKGINEGLDELGEKAKAVKTDIEALVLAAEEGLGRSLKNSAEGLSDAFAQLGATGRLSMKTLGEAVKKAVGAQIQQIGALAFVRSLFELAAGFASLFLNPAEVGAHFQAAALFAIIGAAASVAGGAIAGSAGGAGAVGGLAGSAGEGLAAEEIPQRRGEVAISITNNGTMTENVGEIIVASIKEAIDDDRLLLQGPQGAVSAA